MALSAAEEVSSRIDLDEVPFTLPLSRVLVLKDPQGGIAVHQVRYEVPLRSCTLLERLEVTDPEGRPIRPTVSGGSHLRWGEDGPLLAITGADEVLVGPVPHGWQVTWEPGALADEVPVRPATAVTRDEVTTAAARAQRLVDDWLDRCPQVLTEHREMTLFCWWVLGVNTLRLGGAVSGRAVVPSKIGYVGLWQWDAYFIAIGLRHGAPDLAVEQLWIALEHQHADGQLPDVVHEAGVLASSDDLPAADLEKLRAMGSATLNRGRVPLTKPPLTALAVDLVDGSVQGDLVAELGEAVAQSQEWWFDCSDTDHDGVPEYLHPYSSGLDDSPVFYLGAPVESPDLTAYLCLQDEILARWARQRGDLTLAQRHLGRADALRRRLAQRLEDGPGWVPAVCGVEQSPHLTVVSLLPVIAPAVAPEVTASVLSLLRDPSRFGGRTPVPTVSRDDAAFSPERMWRGPVWVNTAWLLAHGLRLQGETAEAERVETAILELVVDAGGPAEYFNPDTRRRASTATRCFGWSAALFVDLAVRAARS